MKIEKDVERLLKRGGEIEVDQEALKTIPKIPVSTKEELDNLELWLFEKENYDSLVSVH